VTSVGSSTSNKGSTLNDTIRFNMFRKLNTYIVIIVLRIELCFSLSFCLVTRVQVFLNSYVYLRFTLLAGLVVYLRFALLACLVLVFVESVCMVGCLEVELVLFI
jgi:hypothetical protein